MASHTANKLRAKLIGAGWAIILVSSYSASAATPDSALAALRLLPVEEQRSLARIEGPDGALRPERWYFDVYAKDSKTGLREYVVAGHKIVANRELSQFTWGLTMQDVMDNRFLHADSVDVERLAREYASANNQVIAALDLTLDKPVRDARPVWTARCFGPSGRLLGYLLIAAENGTVFIHQGFPIEPNSLVASSESATRRHGFASPRVDNVRMQNSSFEPARQNPQKGRPLKTAPAPPHATYPSPNGHAWWSFLSR